MHSYRELTESLAGPGYHIALLPVGCYEQHGPELPLDTDSLIAQELAARLARRWTKGTASVLPCLHYTPTEPNKAFAGTVSVAGDAARPYLEAVMRAILRTSYQALVVLNAHGSVDSALKECAFKIVLEQFESGGHLQPILCLNGFDVWPKIEGQFGQKPGRHADWTEFLLTFALLGRNYYDAARLARLQAFARGHDFTGRFPKVLGIPARLRTVDGVQGEPWPASELPLERQAAEYWDWLEEETHAVLMSELEHFQVTYGRTASSRPW